ncbi:hypothetical protein H4R20_002768 [Coemansia guatemalensis]|uniref:Uncharacterized protein n=1 Tax=Coemansia guatemalensis TaxID=2761395 RepID=A0A9W8LTN5_9FUNG|nr:hypothetical protein H4R20_002768 [Coemansia guatemalensis]
MFDVSAYTKQGLRRIRQFIGMNNPALATNTSELHLDANEGSAATERWSENDTAFGNTRTKPRKLIVAARVKTDQAFLQHSRIMLPLTVALIALLSLVYSDGNPWSREYVRAFITFHIVILDWLCILPQAIVNYRAKSGSLIPPIISISYTCHSVLLAFAMHLLGSDGAFTPQRFDWACHAATAVYLIQWINYRKHKQE